MAAPAAAAPTPLIANYFISSWWYIEGLFIYLHDSDYVHNLDKTTVAGPLIAVL